VHTEVTHLKLVDQDVEAALENSGCGPEQPETEDKEVVEIERVGFSERLLVVGVELRWHR
jgi:hypothetical protein